MSRLTAWERCAWTLAVPCSFCGASTDQRCMTAAGGQAGYPHQLRSADARGARVAVVRPTRREVAKVVYDAMLGVQNHGEPGATSFALVDALIAQGWLAVSDSQPVVRPTRDCALEHTDVRQVGWWVQDSATDHGHFLGFDADKGGADDAVSVQPVFVRDVWRVAVSDSQETPE